MELTINIDGGSRGNPGPGASAWVIKDAKGKLIVQEGLFFRECTNNQAEFTALKMALSKALELGAKTVRVRSDSLLLVKQFLGEYKIKNPQLQEIMGEIKQLSARLKIYINHVPREQNKEADLMCNITMDKHLKGGKTHAPQVKIAQPAPAPQTVKKVAVAAKPAQVQKQPAKQKEAQPAEQLELFDLNNL
jgi:ribonuclease HI